MAATNASFPAVLALFNALNGTTYTYNDVAIEQVQATTTAEASANGGANTKAWIRPIKKLTPTLGGSGVWIYYNRQPLANLQPANATAVALSGTKLSEQVQYVFPTAFNNKSQHTDFVGQLLPSTISADVTTTVTADAGSVAYTGSTTFKFNRKGGVTLQPVDGSRQKGVAVVNVAFFWQISAAYSATVSVAPSISGSLPPGLSLSYNSSTQIATISGTPTTAGTYNFNLNLTFSGSGQTSQARTIVVHPTAVGSWNSNAGSPSLGTPSNTGDRFTAGPAAATTAEVRSQVLSTGFNLASGTKKYYIEFQAHKASGTADLELGLSIVQGVPGGTRISDSPNCWMLQRSTGEIRNNGILLPGGQITAAGGLLGALFYSDSWVGFYVDATVLSAVKVWVTVNGSQLRDTNGNFASPTTGNYPTFTFDATGAAGLWACAGFHAKPGDVQYQGQMVQMAQSSTDMINSIVSGFTAPYST